jgi:phosphatidylglycerol:prolipoprotein diacylglycerol transferase
MLLVLSLDFDPVLRIAGLILRWQTIATAAAIAVAISLAGVLAGRIPRLPDHKAYDATGSSPSLSREELLFLVLGAVPGAIVGGRLGYVIAHADFYRAYPDAIVDPARGSLSLSMAIVGGTITALLVSPLSSAPVDRWMQVAAIPLLVAIALGKAALVLGGAGQGKPAEVPWATAFVGPGPWASTSPAIPAHPAQAYEAIAAIAAIAAILALRSKGHLRVDGRLFFAAICCWAIGRVIVGFFWLDEPVLGPFGAEQVLTLAVAALSLVLWITGLPRRLLC